MSHQHPEPPPREAWATGADEVRRVLVVGGGPAAHRCVTGLRKLGFDGSVTMVTAEPIPPYDRTLLSKDNLAGGGPGIAAMAPPGRYEELDITVLLGREAVGLDARERTLELGDGSHLEYDRIVLAVGGLPILPQALAAPGVLTMRTAQDVPAVRDAMERSRHVVVIGGGFIGGEIAAAATAHGCGVTLVEACDFPLQSVLGPEVGALVAELHRAKGVDLRCGVAVDRVAEDAGGYRVVLADGAEVRCDSVVVGVGMRPSIDWLRSSGLEMNGAVVTNADCRTSLPGVLAAGDCVRWWSRRYGAYCHVEHWDTAGKHGAAAARAVLGHPAGFDPIPFFWSDQYDVKYQWAGHAPSWDTVEISAAGPTDFTARYRVEDRLVGVLVANRPREFGQLRRDLADTNVGAEAADENDKEVVAR
jgi:3-phenylpropionate/trans-cinnamate dioxygenase ferredoxin reductase subunit